MDQVNSKMALVMAQSKLGMQIEQERKPVRHWSESTERLTILLFTRLADLFGSKAANKGLIIFDDQERGEYSDQFELWCRKLDDLTVDDFKRGMEGLEKRAEQEYRQGAEMWPPSYAEFRALAFPESGHDTQAHKLFKPLGLPEPMEHKQQRYKTGSERCQELLAMLEGDKPEPKPLTDAEKADLERLERIKNERF